MSTGMERATEVPFQDLLSPAWIWGDLASVVEVASDKCVEALRQAVDGLHEKLLAEQLATLPLELLVPWLRRDPGIVVMHPLGAGEWW